MTLARTVAEILREHVTLEVEGIDRMYLNAFVPILQTEGGISWFFRECRGYSFASSALMAPMTRAFVESVEEFAGSEKLEVVTFDKKQRKDDVAAEYRGRFRGEEGILIRGQGAREGVGLPNGTTEEPPDGCLIRLAVPFDGDGEPVLLLRHRP